MCVNNRAEIINQRQSNSIDLRRVMALESISDTLNDIYYKLHDINSNLCKG
jgi:hypothetical protein